MVNDKIRLTGLLNRIHMSRTYSAIILNAYEQWKKDTETNSIELIRDALNQHEVLQNQEKTIMLLLILALKDREYGLWKKYPEAYFINTMSAFTRFVDFYKEATGKEGYGKALWPLLHVNAKIFRIGILEYEIFEEKEIREVHMHIPKGVVLNADNMIHSVREARNFLNTYYKDYASSAFTCESWMLSPVLKEMLPINSKILWFQSLFRIDKFLPEEMWYLEFVFHLEFFQWANGIDYHTLREDTSLQRAMKQYVLSGGKPGAVHGYLREEIQ